MRIIKPNNIKSRPLTTEEDYNLAHKLTGPMSRLCHKLSRGKRTVFAVTHCQTTNKDPLRFFVTRMGALYINPKIIDCSDETTSPEGCLSFPKGEEISVKRFNKLTVSINGVESIKEGKLAFIIQHEIDHFDGKNIYGK